MGQNAVTLPRVIVNGSQLQSTFTAQQMQDVFSQFRAGDMAWESILREDPNHPTPMSPSVAYLYNHPGFLALPTHLQMLIGGSQTASALFASFFASGGTIAGTNMATAQFFDGSPPRIEINGFFISQALTAQNLGDTATAKYYSDLLAGLLSHEIGHYSVSHVDFDRTGGIQEYATYRTRYESLAIYASLVMTGDMEVQPVGYATTVQLSGLYSEYIRTDDWNALMNDLDNVVRQKKWDGGTDVDGDGQTTHLDKFLSEYPY